MKTYENTDLTPGERAEALLSELSLEEKLAQVRGMWGIPEHTEWGRRLAASKELQKAYEENFACGIGQVSTLAVRELHSRDEAAAFQRGLQKKIMEKSPHHIPAVFHMEGLCGPFIAGSTSFPTGLARAASFDPLLEEKIGRIVARQELALGITQVLAPVLDISRDSRMGRQGETYGEDPALASAMGAAYVKGIQETEVDGRHADACAKHFLGFHNSMGGIHGASVEMGEGLTREIYAKPFQAAISLSDLHSIMPSYNAICGLPVSASKKYLTGLLREEMGFTGCTLSDYEAVGNVHTAQKVGETLEEAGALCLAAGMDCELPSGTAFGSAAFRALLEGEAPDGPLHRALDRAVRDVLTAKFRMGLFEHPYALEGDAREAFFLREEDAAVTLQSAREGIVLLKNDGILPLCPEKIHRIAVIGPHAASPRRFFGGYTHLSMVEATMAGANATAGVGASGSLADGKIQRIPGSLVENDEDPRFDRILDWVKPGCPSLLTALAKAFPGVQIKASHGYYTAGDDRSGFAEALAACRGADVILLTLGGKYGSCSLASMGEGVDGTDINLPPAQDAFLREAAKLGIPMVGIHFDGRPISSDAADETLSAILETWSLSEAGGRAIAEVLSGTTNPSGRMAVTTARCAGQIPVCYNHPNGSAWHQGDSIGFADYVDCPHRPRYYFGYGLSYTAFSYSDLAIDRSEVAPDGLVHIRAVVKNIGNRPGTETAQLYVRDVYASTVRPALELAGFARVALAPGQAKQVTFTLAPSQLAFVDADGRWKIERGEIQVFVGPSSREEDLVLQGAFSIAQDRWIEGKRRAFFAKAAVD